MVGEIATNIRADLGGVFGRFFFVGTKKLKGAMLLMPFFKGDVYDVYDGFRSNVEWIWYDVAYLTLFMHIQIEEE